MSKQLGLHSSTRRLVSAMVATSQLVANRRGARPGMADCIAESDTSLGGSTGYRSVFG